MPVNPEKKKYSYTYITDFNVDKRVRLSAEHAAIGSFASADSSVPGKDSGQKIRQIHGVTADGLRRTTVFAASLAVAESMVNSGAFTWDGDAFVITGYTGERLTLSKPGP